MPLSPTAPQTPQPEKPRATPVPHRDTLRGQIKFAIPIVSTDMATIQAANDLLTRAVKLLTDGKAYAEAEASLGRTKGTLLP